MKKITLLLSLFFVFGCGNIPVDKTPAPIDNGLYLAEIAFEGKRDLGLMSALVDDPGERYFEIPLYYRGSYSIRSQRCNVDIEQRYNVKRSPRMERFYLKDLMEWMPASEFACIFDLQVHVDGMDKGVQGQFYILKKEKGFKYISTSIMGRNFKEGTTFFQMRDGANANTLIKFNVDSPGTLYFEGCGRRDDMRFEKSFSVPLSFIVGEDPESCFYSIGLDFDDGTDGLNEFNFKSFDKSVLQLSRPSLEVKWKRIKVRAPSPVAYVGVGLKYKKGRKISKKINKNSTYWVRSVTANGRYSLFGVRNGRIIWTPSILY